MKIHFVKTLSLKNNLSNNLFNYKEKLLVKKHKFNHYFGKHSNIEIR